MKRVVMATAAALVLVGSMVSTAAAAPPQPVSIDSHMTINFPYPSTGTFAASGSDLICATGTVFDDRLLITGGPSRAGKLQILVAKTFTGDDQSGTFVIRLQVHANPDGSEWFMWAVQGGTGDYVNLGGSGRGTTVPGSGSVDNFRAGFFVG